MNTDLITGAIGGLLLGLVIGGVVTGLRGRRRLRALEEERTRLEVTLETERAAHATRLDDLKHDQDRLAQLFASLSNKALAENSQQFLTLASEKLQQFNIQSKEELGRREQAVEALVKPIREVMERTREQIQRIEKDRHEAFGALERHLASLVTTQQALQGETRRLVQSLRRPEVRGQWGELTLKRLVELAGMVEYCDFYEQESVGGDEGVIRPDMIVRMPGGREVVVDVKTPLDAYLSAVEAEDEEERRRQLERHARKVRERVTELAGKAYWKRLPNSPEFVVLFIPGEQFLSAALERDPGLLEDALARKVILATPTSLVALLRAIAYGWKQVALTENARQIQQLGEDLYKRLRTFNEHLGRLGRSLGSSLDHYNKAVGSFDRQVLSGARRFRDMGIQASDPLDAPEPIDRQPRRPAGAGRRARLCPLRGRRPEPLRELSGRLAPAPGPAQAPRHGRLCLRAPRRRPGRRG